MWRSKVQDQKKGRTNLDLLWSGLVLVFKGETVDEDSPQKLVPTEPEEVRR